MKKRHVGMALFLALAMALPALAAEFEFHGDLNNRFLLYTPRQDYLRGDNLEDSVINDKDVSEAYGELKYRFWFDASTNDGNIKGTYAIEIGGIRFGESTQGGAFSGDDTNIETRWAYLDFQIPGVATKARFRMGLMPVSVNEYLWQETATGVTYTGAPNDAIDYQLGYWRGFERFSNDLASRDQEDQDNLYLRLNFNADEKTRIGVFGLYQTGDPDSAAPVALTSAEWYLKKGIAPLEHDIWTLGVDGGTEVSNFFIDWNLMYQGGEINNTAFTEFFTVTGNTGDFDMSAYFVNFDVGYKQSNWKLTYRFWWASGDDDPTDDEFNSFLSTDLDRADSIALHQFLYVDDSTYFTDRPYFFDKGLIFNKVSWDQQLTEKFSYGLAGLYILTAEDVEYLDGGGNAQSNSDIGFEGQAYVKYMMYSNTEVAWNLGYLFSGDAMDALEVDSIRDGSADENIWGSSVRIRYKF